MSATVWDISVAGVHNFYVAADHTSVPVLVHNADEVCSLQVSLDAFDELLDFVDSPGISPSAVAGINAFFDDALDVARRGNLTQTEFEAGLEQVARIAEDSPQTLETIAARETGWLNEGLTAGPVRFGQLLDAAVEAPVLARMPGDVVANLGAQSGAEIREVAEIIGELVDVRQPVVEAVLLQDDVIGGVRQLVPGAPPRLITVNGETFALDAAGRRVDINSPGAARPSRTLGDGSTVYELRTSDGVRFELTYDPDGFPVFPFEVLDLDTNSPIRVLVADLSFTADEIATSTGDFRMANGALQELVLTEDLSVRDLPQELRDFYRNASDTELNNSPGGYTWHHHQETGRMQLVVREFHGASSHTGGSRLWGDRFVRDL